MTKLFAHWDDILAGVLIVGCIVLIAQGVDNDIKAILTLAAGYVFGKNEPAIAAKLDRK